MIISIFGKTGVTIALFILVIILVLGILFFLLIAGLLLYNYLFKIKKHL